MKCPICARETDSDAVFCEICGKKIPRCPSCGKVLYERSRFCDHDGAPLPEELFLDFPPEPAEAVRPAGGQAVPPPAPPHKKKSGAPLVAVLILLAVLLLAAGAGGYVLLGGELPFLSGEQPEEPPSASEDEDWDEPEEDDPAETALASARDYAEEEEYLKALREIRRALEEKPSSKKLLEARQAYIADFETDALERAEALAESGGLPDAVRAVREALDALGEESEALSGRLAEYEARWAGDAAALAERLEEEQRLEEAKAQLDEALALFPENAELRGTLARVEELMEQANRVPPISMDAVTAVDATSYLIQSSYSLYHTPDRMMDGDLSTAWVEGASGDGIGESVTFTFDGTYLVSGFQIYAGYQKSDALYEKNSRPADIAVTFSNGDEAAVTLADESGSQYIAFDAPVETSSVTLTIDSVYSGSKYEDTVISEITFY